MEPPKDADVYESKTGFVWEEDGILCSISKPDVPKLNKEEGAAELERFIARFGKGPHCFLIDGKHMKPSSREERIEAAKVLPQFTKAIALIVHNPMGRVLINLFTGLQKPPYPIKIFKPIEWDKAKEWLKQYL